MEYEYQGMLLHNVQELIYDQEYKDCRLSRVPESLRLALNSKAQKNIRFVSGCELRFVMESSQVSIGLRRMPVSPSILSQGMVQVYQGDFQGSYQIGPQAVTTEGSQIVIHKQDFTNIRQFWESGRKNSRFLRGFSPEVTRILLPYDWGCFLGEIQGKIRPPKPSELPAKRLLVYGSSITHGGNASLMSKTYAFRLVESLGADCINLGCAGSAWMDSAMGAWIAGRKDWDMALFELGVNVIGVWSPQMLYEAAGSFIRQVKEAQPDKPVWVTDMYYNHHDFHHDPKASAFRDAIKTCVEQLKEQYPRLEYLNGLEIMGEKDGFTCLSSDGLHPSDLGHEVIAQRLSERLA
ncbi:MAG TPA: hypothetical protein IAA51_00245 [Candidatus Cottocaccamicrobium excrementipullorum]|nr:hypothetical protein [Candidatus Cottocaccamicrobium excrementipullorum]